MKIGYGIYPEKLDSGKIVIVDFSKPKRAIKILGFKNPSRRKHVRRYTK